MQKTIPVEDMASNPMCRHALLEGTIHPSVGTRHISKRQLYPGPDALQRQRLLPHLRVCMLLRARATIISSSNRSRFLSDSRGTASFPTATPQQNSAKMADKFGLSSPPGGLYAQHFTSTAQVVHYSGLATAEQMHKGFESRSQKKIFLEMAAPQVLMQM